MTFATDPPSRSLARDIAAEAVITVSFARHLHFDPSRGIRTSYSTAPTSSAASAATATTESSGGGRSFFGGLRRLATTPPRRAGDGEGAHRRMLEKPLPAPPPEATTSEARVLQTTRAHGFTRAPSASRGKHKKEGSGSGPGILFVPDGVYKGKLDLSSEALPTITYGGANVKVRFR